MAVIKGSSGSNILFGTNGADYITGRAGNDFINGGAGDDYLYGGIGHDLLLDGAGADNLFGQAGDDQFIMYVGEADVVDGGDGFDIVRYNTSGGGPTLVDLRNTSLNSGAAAGDILISIEGFQGSNSTDFARGTDQANLFIASYGNDVYSGRGGIDVYQAVREISFSESGAPIRVINFEVAFGDRAQTLALAAGIAAPAADYAVAYYDIWQDSNLNDIVDAGEVTNKADRMNGIEHFVGTHAADIMTGSSAAETFDPLLGANKVDGKGGYDTLSYEFLGSSPTGDLNGVVVDLAGGTAVAGETSTITSIEAVTGSIYNDQIAGDEKANLLVGMDGEDALNGRGGADFLYGGSGSDILVGDAGDDLLDGGLGDDLIDGGGGVDTLSYAESSTSVAVSLLRGEGFNPIINEIAIDAQHSNGDSVLNIENLIGSRFADIMVGDDQVNRIEGGAGDDTINGCGGNDLIYGDFDPASSVTASTPGRSLDDNNLIDDCGCETGSAGSVERSYDDVIYGGDGADTIFGQLGDDELYGKNDNDIIYGDEGRDIIDGGSGDDRLDGGLGTDIIYGGKGSDRITGGAGFDIIFGGEGRDRVDYSTSTAGVTVNLGQFWMNNGGDASSDLLADIMQQLAEGSDPEDVLSSALFLSFLSLIAPDGGDTGFTLRIPDVILGVEDIMGSQYDDFLTGDDFANTLFGGAGDDVLDGAGGDDILSGGTGNDLFKVDSSGDKVVEDSSTGGIDTVESTHSFVLAANVENLVLIGSRSANATGNGLANTLIGNAANNILDGRGGADKMDGRGGDDTYVVDNARDEVAEGSASGGTDTVRSVISYSLGANIENLSLEGNKAINGFGNSLNNIIKGNDAANRLSGNDGHDTVLGGQGDDTLAGGYGQDTLRGDAGKDMFLFNTPPAAANVDHIEDYDVANDTIALLRPSFVGIGSAGPLAASAFQIGASANDAGDRIIYSQATGEIFFDADGSGAGAAMLFATVTPGTALTAAEFIII